ncbi:hypothetical protein PMAYCL1PPCAC_27958, partial [Pristionchus mayeri]
YATDETKEEPMEFKDEPIDNVDFKQEDPLLHGKVVLSGACEDIKDETVDDFAEIGQPIADIFCPSTGTSR